MKLRQSFGDRQAQTRPVIFAVQRAFDLGEGLKGKRHFVRAHADAGIHHLDIDTAVLRQASGNHNAPAAFGELDRIGQDVQEDLLELQRIGDQWRKPFVNGLADLNPSTRRPVDHHPYRGSLRAHRHR